MNEPSIASEVLMAMGRVEGRVEQFLNQQARQDERLNNHAERLSVLERGHARILGWAVGVGAAAGALWAAIGLALNHGKIGA
ncbi:hypothetical protein [Caulobacter segnis]|uniref:hypothetical protein n=1 Tax=Caulobacter segnis TaxID=88688 RepID=UPI0028572A6D|nr:hypothetical protein [Caulobacter segnis]MDR6624343.1 hypothetical protein [Caulobacter segnis]